MWQKTQSSGDTQLRTTLENMHYKACTPADLAFLCSCITSSAPGRLSVQQKQFRNVSVITVHKDEINHLGSIRFAKETGQSLTHFFSEDSVSVKADTKRRQAYKRSEVKVTSISDAIQELLWNQPHSANTKIIPGKLSICLEMPVIIHHNAATELCITKGQEGVIHGWQSSIGSCNQRVLDVLFVKLLNPPQTIKLDGLEENVVPLTPPSVGTVCFLPDD